MTPRTCFVAVCSVVMTIALHAAALAEPVKGKLSTGERPQGDVGPAPQKAATYGLCNAPQNADDFPARPVPVQQDQCSYSQQFSATSGNTKHRRQLRRIHPRVRAAG